MQGSHLGGRYDARRKMMEAVAESGDEWMDFQELVETHCAGPIGEGEVGKGIKEVSRVPGLEMTTMDQ